MGWRAAACGVHHRAMRPSDAFRRRTVAALGRDYAVGRMGSDTLEARLDRAFAARSSADLLRLRADTSPLAAALAELRRRWSALMAPAGPGARRRPAAAPADAERPLLIGRGRACDLVLRHETVSRRHAELHREGGRWLLRDVGSTNGTWDGALARRRDRGRRRQRAALRRPARPLPLLTSRPQPAIRSSAPAAA